MFLKVTNNGSPSNGFVYGDGGDELSTAGGLPSIRPNISTLVAPSKNPLSNSLRCELFLLSAPDLGYMIYVQNHQ